MQSPTLKSHQRQRFWQILLPIILVILLAIVAGVFTTQADAGQAGLLAEVSAIWLIAPLMLFALLCMVLLGGMIYAIARLTKITPVYTARAQKFAARLESGTRRAADAAVKPVVWSKQAGAVIKSILEL